MAKPDTKSFDRESPSPTTNPAPAPAEVRTPAGDMNAYIGPRCTGCGTPLTGPLAMTMTSCDACWRKANVMGVGPTPGHAKVTVKG